MKVFEVMTTDVGVCGLEDNLTHAAEIMWQKDCGIVPVVDAGFRVAGVVTDRDICIAAASRDKSPAQIKMQEMNFRPPVCCTPEDKVKEALKIMRRNKIKRLPVTNENGELLGIVSLSDILLKAEDKKSVGKKVLKTLLAIFSRAPIVLSFEEGDDDAGDDENELTD